MNKASKYRLIKKHSKMDKKQIFKLIESNSVEIEESSKNGIIAHHVDVDELVNSLFALFVVLKPLKSKELPTLDEYINLCYKREHHYYKHKDTQAINSLEEIELKYKWLKTL